MEILVLNENFKAEGLVESAESFYWIDRYSEPGEFEIYTDATYELVSLLSEDRYLSIPQSSKHMIIESRTITEDVEDGRKLIVKGRSLESILDRRIIWTQTLIDDIDVETAVFGFLDDAFITGVSDANRIISNFITTASGDSSITGINITIQLDGENILDLVNDIVQSNQFGYQIHLTSANQFEFKLYNGKDRSYDQSQYPYIVFSPNFDNLISSEFKMTKRYYKNFALWVGDESNTTSLIRGPRATPEGLNAVGLNRREIYLDQQNYSRFVQGTSTPIDPDEYTNQMREIALQTLNNNYSVFVHFDGNVDITYGAVYGTDYHLGDIVQIENQFGMTAKSRIIEMTYSEDETGIYNYPTFKKI